MRSSRATVLAVVVLLSCRQEAATSTQQQRSGKPAHLYMRPFSICQVNRDAATVVRGRITSWQSKARVVLASAQSYGGEYSRLSIATDQVVRGLQPPSGEIWIRGAVLNDGRSEQGKLVLNEQVFLFLTQSSGYFYVHPSGGVFRRGPAGFSNTGLTKDLPEMDLLSIAYQPSPNGKCAEDPDPPGSRQFVFDAGSGTGRPDGG